MQTKEHSIQSLNIDDLRKYQGNEHCSIYQGVLVRRNHSIGPTFREPIRLDMITFILCTKGESRLNIDQHEIDLKKHSLVIIPPRSIVSSSLTTEPIEGMIIMLDMRYMNECNLNVKKITQYMLKFANRALATQLNDTEAQQMAQSFEMLITQLNDSHQSIFKDDVIRSTVEMITYFCMDLITRRSLPSAETTSSPTSTRSEEYFRRFITELSQHYLERQPVTFYANQLCISARYLTTIVRRVSGVSVSHWMNRYILTEAKYLLKYSELSIQEIAYKLSFPNQSFFGKYFKQHTGSSPSAYRAQF